MLTSDPIYWKPYQPRITIKNTANSSTYYTYDPFTEIESSKTNKPNHLQISLSENSHGTFVCQIEDQGQTLNRNNINKGARLIVEVGKQPNQMTRVLSGLIRKTGDSRGANKKDLYNLFGSSTGLRQNERIIYIQKEPETDNIDGMIPDNTDASMKTDTLLYNLFTSAYSAVPFSGSGSESSLGILSLSSLVSDSDVETIVPGLTIEYGEIADGVSQLEELSNSEFNITTVDKGALKFEMRNPLGGNGFTIKNNNEPYDDADDTCYLIRKRWNYDESVYKADGYANRLFSVLPAPEPDPVPTDLDNMTGSNTTSQDNAQKFRPKFGRILPQDIKIIGRRIQASSDTIAGMNSPRISIMADAGGVPQNTDGVLYKIFLSSEGHSALEFGESDSEASVWQGVAAITNKNGFRFNEINLDTTKDYWIKVQGSWQGFGINTAYFRWEWKDSSIGIRAFRSPSSNTYDGGSGWTVISGSFWWSLTPGRSYPFMATDPKAIKNLGSGLSTGGTPIEATLPAPPSTTKTKESMMKYLANQLYYMARPRSNFQMSTVTAPNIPIVPGDPIVISDEILGFSRGSNQIVLARCGDMTYSWGSFDGAGLSYDAPTKININPVSIPSRYK